MSPVPPASLQPELHALARVATDAASEAAALLRTMAAAVFRDPAAGGAMKGTFDVVTAGDVAAENALRARLEPALPGAVFVGEESAASAALEPSDAASSAWRWVVDPLDGTTNYAAGIPHVAVSVALVDPRGVPAVGCVYDVFREAAYTAVRGAGATGPDGALRVRSCAHLEASVLATGFAYDRAQTADHNVAETSAIVPRVRGLRRGGAAALDFAWVAAGLLDGYWERGLAPWDMAAGMLIAAEAGAVVTRYDGSPAALGHGDVVLASPELHPVLLGAIGDARRAARLPALPHGRLAAP